MPSKSLCTATVVGLALILGLLGCSGRGSGPVLPDMAGTDVGVTQGQGEKALQPGDGEGNRYLWGLWAMNVSADHSRIEAVPLREAGFHLNVVGYLEHPASSLLKIGTVSWSEYGTLLVDIQLIHPFKSSPMLTGRDVRGIAILPGVKLFPNTFVYDVDDDLSQIYASRWLLNADGYTTHWNRWMYKQVFHPQIFGYIRGKYATTDEFYIEGNLHGYKEFSTDPPTRVFQSNQAATRTYEFNFPPGPLTFAYAVDVSWEMPTLPVIDIWNDFPNTAYSIEPYQISASIVNNTLTKLGGNATVWFDVYDWQDATNFSSVHVEAPDLFPGTINPGAPIGYPTPNAARYEVIVPNTLGHAVTAGGGSDLLVAVEDVQNSTPDTDISNVDLTAYNIFKLPVADVPGFWRDRHGDNSFVDVPLKAPLMEPSTLSTGIPDVSVVSRPVAPYAFFAGEPEIMLFDDNDSRFILCNRLLNATWVKAGYPAPVPPSWLLYPTAIDATNSGWLGVASSNTTIVTGNYKVNNIVNVFGQDGIYGWSWHTGSDILPNPYLEKCRDVTAGFGSAFVTGDPLYALFSYESGTAPSRANVLQVASPYINPANPNTLRTYVPAGNAGWVPGAINWDAPVLKCGIDTNPVWQTSNPFHFPFYVVESDPGNTVSEVEGFDITFTNLDPVPIWNLTNADIQAEFPGACALDCEVVPSYTNQIVIIGNQTADYNWLCVLMRDGNSYWLAFYDPLNPSPANPGHNVKHSIFTSNKIPMPGGEPAPVALDVDNRYFEVYVLAEDLSSKFYMSVFEFYYFIV